MAPLDPPEAPAGGSKYLQRKGATTIISLANNSMLIPDRGQTTCGGLTGPQAAASLGGAVETPRRKRRDGERHGQMRETYRVPGVPGSYRVLPTWYPVLVPVAWNRHPLAARTIVVTVIVDSDIG